MVTVCTRPGSPPSLAPDAAPSRLDRVAVVVVAYHGAPWLPACLDSLRAASRRRVLLCLVDNGGNGNSIPAELPDGDYLRIATPHSLGFAEANNFALGRLGFDTDVVCFLNQDTRGAPGWLDACLNCLTEHPDVGAVSPLLRTYDDQGWDPGFRDCAAESAEFVQHSAAGCGFEPLYPVSRITAAAMLVRTDLLRRVGPFDPIFGSYYEDFDLCCRIRRTGARIGVCGAARVCHYSGSSTTSPGAQRRRQGQIIRNRAILRFREAGARRWREIARYLAITLPRNLGRSLLGTPSSQPLPVLLDAHWQLARQWRRLASQRYDHQAWLDYLRTIGWPGDSEAQSAGSTN